MVVWLLTVQVIGVPEHVTTVEPMTARSFEAGREIGEDHAAVPLGTVMVSPETAAVTQSLTSVREALSA
jgi:hypothetical protein